MSRNARLLVTYLNFIDGYFSGNIPAPRNLVDTRITYVCDTLGSWLAYEKEPVVRYNVSVLYDFVKGDRPVYIDGLRQAAQSLAARCIPIVSELGQL